MPPMADGGSQRGYFGRTESPYNQEYMCTSYASGSSSGSGVATAAGFAPIGLGSETVSSGRAPASINGIVGYSPSWGAVPCRGVWPLYPTCDVLTPHTKIVEDMLAVLDVIMADEPTSDGDFWRTQETIQIPKSSEIRPKSFSSLMDPIALKGKRLAVPKCYIGKGTTTAGDAPAFADSIGALWLQAKKDLEALGAKRCHVPGMPEGWIDIERGQRIALGWDNFLRTNDAPNCKTLATVHHKKIRPFYASLDDPRKHTEAQNHVRYADIVEYIRHRPESIHDLPGCAEALRSLEAARKRDLDSWLDEHGCDAIVFPTNGDVPRADAEEVLSSMQHALRDGVKYSNGTRALKHMGVPAITRPPWMDGGVKQKEETQRIKAAVKKNFKQLRRQQVRAAQTRSLETANERPATADGPLTQAKADEESTTLQKEAGAIAPHFPLLDDPLSVDFPFSDDLATFLGPVPDSEDSTRKHFAPSYEESELLMYYLDRIFPMQYTHYSNRKWGRGWLFWLLNKNGPLYKAALSLAALHKHSLMCAVNEDLRHNDVLLEYHTSALRGLQDFIGQPQGYAVFKDDEDFIEVIACGSALISFEVFRGGKGDWQPHLQATTAIMKTMDLSRLAFHASGRIESFVSSSARERRGIDAALSFHAPVLLWMDLLACASTGNVPFLPYETWLQMEGFDMTKIMGCQNWVMKAIGDLAVLEERKVSLKGQTEDALLDWIGRARKIGDELEAGMEGLDLRDEANNPASHVTRIFATAALVQLYATRASLALSEPAEGQRSVARVIGEIRRMPRATLSIRQLTWPICVVGSMAAPHQQAFFEDLVSEVLVESDASFGNCRTVNEIIRQCWDHRNLHPGQHWDWRRAMADMGICALLI
ncbi:hypothetical protein BN1708_004080 [Verticillium longisporum]|uniref:Amidase domain-containing protein n=1 Tax=Verticillium longisporum TaxID=100787 RepID=A0A0G4LVK4_VERLO|nr:hypothetical protein BN1708_004080 [Verticillium longisporum]